MNNFGEEIESGIQYAAEETNDIITSVLHANILLKIAHISMAILLGYVIYLFVTSPMERSLTNYLLLLVVVSITVQVYQNFKVMDNMRQNA